MGHHPRSSRVAACRRHTGARLRALRVLVDALLSADHRREPALCIVARQSLFRPITVGRRALVVLSMRLASVGSRHAYSVFVFGSLLLIGLNVLGYYYFHFRVIGEPPRLVPELDLVIILAATAILRALWNRRSKLPERVRLARALALVLVLCRRLDWPPLCPPRLGSLSARLGLSAACRVSHVRLDHRAFAASANLRGRLPALLVGHLARPGAARAAARNRGSLNSHVVPAQWELNLGPSPELGVRWLTALGADAAIVNDRQSQEIISRSSILRTSYVGVLPILYDDHEGNVIYRVPRRYPSLARVVDSSDCEVLRPLAQTDLESLRAYTAVIEEGPDAPTTTALGGHRSDADPCERGRGAIHRSASDLRSGMARVPGRQSAADSQGRRRFRRDRCAARQSRYPLRLRDTAREPDWLGDFATLAHAGRSSCGHRPKGQRTLLHRIQERHQV